MNRGIKHMYDHLHCTAGKLLALQPTDVTITRTVRNYFWIYTLAQKNANFRHWKLQTDTGMC